MTTSLGLHWDITARAACMCSPLHLSALAQERGGGGGVGKVNCKTDKNLRWPHKSQTAFAFINNLQTGIKCQTTFLLFASGGHCPIQHSIKQRTLPDSNWERRFQSAKILSLSSPLAQVAMLRGGSDQRQAAGQNSHSQQSGVVAVVNGLATSSHAVASFVRVNNLVALSL